MLVSDLIIDYLASLHVKHVFLITGAAIAFTVDSFRKRKDIIYICMQHEQAAAMAAEAYSRMGPDIGVAMGTSGPGATNLITGICGAWFDSIPTIYITGQVNTNELSKNSKVRQTGFQETNIVKIIKPITKFATQVKKPEEIKFLLEKAVYIAKNGRPGPVLLDIPINIQYAEVDPKILKSYQPSKNLDYQDFGADLKKKVKSAIKLIEKSTRPVILAGFGNHLAKSEKELQDFVNKLGFPVVTTWSGLDLMNYDNPLLIGQAGVYGARSANFAIQNADLLISIGARLDTRQTGSKPQNYARGAKKIVVDIDKAELDKRRGLIPDIPINTDTKLFLQEILAEIPKIKKPKIDKWLRVVKDWKFKYPTILPQYQKQKSYVNPYHFISTLSEMLPDNAIIIPDEGGNLTWTMQSFKIKNGQRLFSTFGNSPMGYALPAAIGACFAVNMKRPVICITGDGGLQINIQEFQTVVHHKLPLKIFILNNKSYGIIKQFQDTWLESRYEASEKGYSTPDFVKVASAYKIKTVQIKNHKELKSKISQVLNFKGPVFCDVLLHPDQKIIPKIEFGMPLEDMTPYLKRQEFIKNMIVKPLPESLTLELN